MLRKFLYKLKSGTERLNYGREIVAGWAVNFAEKSCNNNPRILDIGCSNCIDISNIRREWKNEGFEFFGVEIFEPYIKLAKSQGVTVFPINLENQAIPLENHSVDIVIANQIFEHIKEIFWVMSEISRVLRKGGIAIIGLPNLASFHNRIALLFGQQPTCMNLLSEHVRGFTKRGFIEFACKQNFFRILDFKGSNFYPFQPWLSKILCKILPNLSVSIFFLIQRTKKPGNFIEVLQSTKFPNLYFPTDAEFKTKTPTISELQKSENPENSFPKNQFDNFNHKSKQQDCQDGMSFLFLKNLEMNLTIRRRF